MDSTEIMERAKRALRGDASLFSEVGGDESHTGSAAALVTVIGAVSGLLQGVFGSANIISATISGIVGAFIAWGLGTALFFGLGKLFGGDGDFTGLARSNAYAAVPSALGGIPFLGIVAFFYSVYLYVLSVRENMGLSTGAAVAVVLLPIGILILLAALLFAAALAAFIGAS